MGAHQRILLVLLLALLPPEMLAQESEPQSPAGGLIDAPVTLNGQGPSPALQSEKIRGSYLSGGIALGSTFTDNAVLSTADRVSNVWYLIQPFVNFAQTTPRLNWQIGLTGAAMLNTAIMVNDQISKENQAAEDLKLDLSYRLAQYVNLRVSSVSSNTTGFFSSLNPVTSGSAIGVIEEANSSLLVPLAQRRVLSSNLAELNYQVGPYSIIGARGTYSILDYPGLLNNAQFGPLYDNRTYSGEAFYNHEISARQWVGVTLRTQKLETRPFPDTKTDSGLLLYGLNITPNVTLSLFAGPEWFDSPQISTVAVGLIRGWTPSGGATFTWRGVRTSLLAEFSRQIEDGGGLFFSAVTLQSANAQLRRQLSSSQQLNFGFSYARNDPLESAQGVRGILAQFQYQRRLAKSLTALIGYTWEQQEYPSGHEMATANLFSLSLSYDFSHGFGR
jgi:hypothetical protein